MPRGDGTGPTGMGPMTGGKGTGRGTGGGAGSGKGAGAGGGAGSGGGRGRMGGKGLGLGGECVCPQCGEKTPHQRGIPCFEQKCPKCGTAMTRA